MDLRVREIRQNALESVDERCDDMISKLNGALDMQRAGGGLGPVCTIELHKYIDRALPAVHEDEPTSVGDLAELKRQISEMEVLLTWLKSEAETSESMDELETRLKAAVNCDM